MWVFEKETAPTCPECRPSQNAPRTHRAGIYNDVELIFWRYVTFNSKEAGGLFELMASQIKKKFVPTSFQFNHMQLASAHECQKPYWSPRALFCLKRP